MSKKQSLRRLTFSKKSKSDYEVIVVNDGSNDATGEIADKIAATK